MVKKFIKNSAWVLGSNVLSKLINFITLGFLARVLNPEFLGFYNAVQNSGNYINMMSSLGTLVVIQRVGAKIKEIGAHAVSEIFSNAFTLYLLINGLAALVLVLFPQYFFEVLLDSQGSVSYVTLICVIVVLNALGQIPLYLILGLEEFRKYSIRNLLSAVIVLLVTAMFVFIMEDNLKASFYGLIVSFFVNMVLTGYVFYYVVRKYSLKIRLFLSLRVLKKVMADGFIYYVGNTLLGSIVGLVIISLFFNYLTPFDYGFTRIGNAFAVLLSIVPSALQPVTLSLLSVENVRNIYIKSLQLRIIPFISTLVLVIVSFNMEFILGLLFGPNYIGAKDIVFGMILVQIPNIYLGLINNYQVGAGYLNFVGFVSIVCCALMIGASVYLVPLFGLKGYFAAMYISTLVGLVLVAYKEYYKRNRLSKVDWNSFWLISVMIAMSYMMMYIVPNFLRIPLTIISIVLAIFLFWQLCIENAEKEMLLVERRKRMQAFNSGKWG